MTDGTPLNGANGDPLLNQNVLPAGPVIIGDGYIAVQDEPRIVDIFGLAGS